VCRRLYNQKYREKHPLKDVKVLSVCGYEGCANEFKGYVYKKYCSDACRKKQKKINDRKRLSERLKIPSERKKIKASRKKSKEKAKILKLLATITGE